MDWLDKMPVKLDYSFNDSLMVLRLTMSLFPHESDTSCLIQKQNFKLDLFLFFYLEDCQTLEEVGQRVCLVSFLEFSKTQLNEALSIFV